MKLQMGMQGATMLLHEFTVIILSMPGIRWELCLCGGTYCTPATQQCVANRDPTAEAHKKAEEDQHASPSNRSEDGGSEHITAPPETKGRSSVSGSESGKRLPERRRSGQQAPIVWQPAANRPNSLFDRHQQQLDALDPMHAQKQDFGVALSWLASLTVLLEVF